MRCYRLFTSPPGDHAAVRRERGRNQIIGPLVLLAFHPPGRLLTPGWEKNSEGKAFSAEIRVPRNMLPPG